MANEISNAFADAFRDFVTNGVPASGKYNPQKVVLRGIGPKIESYIEAGDATIDGRITTEVATVNARINQEVTELQGQIQAAADGSVAASSWATLALLNGTRAGQPAETPVTDTGTHTDPVVGGTVPNGGRFAWSASPAGWRYVGPAVDPTAVRAAINLSSIGILSGSATPTTSNGHVVSWTQARGVWNGAVITIDDLALTTLATTQVLYIDLVSGSSPYAVTKASISSGLRNDFAAGKKLMLLYNQTGSLVGPMAPILYSVVSLARYDPAEIVVQIATNNVISVYVKATANPYSALYIRYRIELIQTPDDGSAAGQADIYTIRGIYEHLRTGPTSFTLVRELCDQGNIEIAIREAGKSDSIGGLAHGDHKKNSAGLTLWIDDKTVSLTPAAVTTYICRSVSFFQSSTLYQADTEEPASIVAATLDQRFEWSNGSFRLHQRLEFTIPMTLTFCMLGMLPANRNDPLNSSYAITTAAERYAPILFENVSDDTYTPQETTANVVKLQGPNGHGFHMEAERGWTEDGRNLYVSNDPTRNKAYLDFTGATSVLAGKVIESTVHYRLSIAA